MSLHGIDKVLVASSRPILVWAFGIEGSVRFIVHQCCYRCLMVLLLCAQQYWHDPTKPYSFVPVAEFAEHFKSFSVGRKIAEDLAKPPPDTPLGSTKHGEPEVCSVNVMCVRLH